MPRPLRPPAALLLLAALAACGDGDAPDDAPSAGRPPNVIVLLADDVGFGDLGPYGGPTPTASLDRLAREGTRFTAAYATAPNCAPSRAALLTGRYPQRFGFEFNPPWQRSLDDPAIGLPEDEVTLAEALKARGYATGVVGKWHLGMHPSHHPLRHGFDAFFGFRMGATAYTLDAGDEVKEEWIPGLDRFQGRHPRDPMMRDHRPIEEHEYLTDAFAREAAAFVRQHRADPFFLYVPFSAAHTPLQVTRRYYDRLSDVEDERTRIYRAMLLALDDAVGAILDAVDACGIAGDTLVVFASDNGGADFVTDTNGALRGGKGTLFEGGLRVPMIVRWPGVVPAGRVEPRMTSILDIAPTALAAAGALAARADDAARPLDGVDLLPILADPDAAPPHEALYWRGGQNAAIRRGDDKLWLVSRRIPWLFDLAADPGESKADAAPDRERLQSLIEALRTWEATLERPRWEGRSMTTTIDGVPVTLTL